MLGLGLFFLTLALSAFFSGSETSYVSANRLKFFLRSRAQTGKKFKKALFLNAEKFLTVTLVGNNVVMVACSSLAVLVLSPWLPQSVLPFFTAVLLLLFGEILPKYIARQMPNRLLRFIPPLYVFFHVILFPLIKLAEWVAEFVVKVLGGGDDTVTTFFKKHDLPILIREYSSFGAFRLYEQLLVKRTLQFGDKKISKVMIPRTDIQGVEAGTPFPEIQRMFIKTGLSRLPVYQDSLDNITGFLYVLDLLDGDKDMERILRHPVFFPENMYVVDALQSLREQRTSIAVVVDEHGGTAGLVTIEDILERILGSIYDEFDMEESHVKMLKNGTIIATGRTEIDDLVERYHLDIPSGDYATLAGYLESRLGYIPKEFEVIRLGNYQFDILRADSTKIQVVKITILDYSG